MNTNMMLFVADRALKIHGLRATAKLIREAAKCIDTLREDVRLRDEQRASDSKALADLKESRDYAMLLLQQANDAVTLQCNERNKLAAAITDVHEIVDEIQPNHCEGY